MTTATPRPWSVGLPPTCGRTRAPGGSVILAPNGLTVAMMCSVACEQDLWSGMAVDEANAGLIVHCVNTYPALVAALEKITSLYPTEPATYAAIRYSKEALALAKKGLTP